jgi:hypothetical protein
MFVVIWISIVVDAGNENNRPQFAIPGRNAKGENAETDVPALQFSSLTG